MADMSDSYEARLEEEQKYLAERVRLNKLCDEEEEALHEKSLEKRIAAAKAWQENEASIDRERLSLRKSADSEYLEQLKTAAENEKEIVSLLKDDITASYKDIAEYIEESLGSVEESRAALEKKLKSYAEKAASGTVKVTIKGDGKLKTNFDGTKFVDNDVTLYGLADQSESINTLLRYSKALNEVKERTTELFDADTAKSFMEALAGMDVEDGALFAETLAAAPAEDFRRYIGDWETKNALAKEISEQLYGEEFTGAVDDCVDYMRTELENLGLEIPDGFFASGSLSASEFGEGFTSGLSDVLEGARSLIESFGSYAEEIVNEETSSVVNNNNYYSTYSINGTKSTAAESIFAAEAAAQMNKYRGIE